MVQYLHLQKLSKIFLKYKKKVGSWPDSILKKQKKRKGFAIMPMYFIFIWTLRKGMLLETGVDYPRWILFAFQARLQLKMEQTTPYVQAQPRIGEKANANGGKRRKLEVVLRKKKFLFLLYVKRKNCLHAQASDSCFCWDFRVDSGKKRLSFMLRFFVLMFYK